MKSLISFPKFAWAVRDVSRYPLDTLLLSLSLAILVFFIGITLLFSQALSATAINLLADSPSLVVRRVSPGGWLPMPDREAIKLAKAVPGVVEARTRIWGTVGSVQGPVTVYSVERSGGNLRSDVHIDRWPARGQALTGPGIQLREKSDRLELKGSEAMVFDVIGALGTTTGMVAHDLVLLHAADARQLLAMPTGYGSDLIIDVFHEQEAKAIIPDLVKTMPWPVQITTRNEAMDLYAAGFHYRAGITYIMLIPAVLALMLIVVATIRKQISQHYEVGLLKALGWTTVDIIRHQVMKVFVVGLPALAAGMLAAYISVFKVGITWPGFLLFGWDSLPPQLHLDASGAGIALVEIGALVFLPYLTAAFWPLLKGAAGDPLDLIEKDSA